MTRLFLLLLPLLFSLSEPAMGEYSDFGQSSLAAKTALQIAEEGGRHAGFLKNYTGKSPAELQKGIASLEKQIAEHQAKIANPEKFIPNFKQFDRKRRLHHPLDIAMVEEV
jgi:hypothetical protein